MVPEVDVQAHRDGASVVDVREPEQYPAGHVIPAPERLRVRVRVLVA